MKPSWDSKEDFFKKPIHNATTNLHFPRIPINRQEMVRIKDPANKTNDELIKEIRAIRASSSYRYIQPSNFNMTADDLEAELYKENPQHYFSSKQQQQREWAA